MPEPAAAAPVSMGTPEPMATPELVAFMIRHTSGILCTPLESAEAKRLQLTPMVAENDAPLSTAFTVSVDYRHGTTTGISAEERCATIRGLANGNSGAEDFVRPGHIFPLVARDGGVLMRTGHTEAAVDLAKLAGLRPVGLIAELVNDDGTVQKGQQVERFAKEHGFALVSIDDMIAYRQGREKLIERVEEREVETLVGPARAIVYSSRYDDAQHVALVFGSPDAAEAPMVRLHLENVVDDVFGGFEQQIWTALRKIKQDGDGVFIYLRSGAVGVAAPPPDDAEEMGAISAKTRKEHWRDVGLGAQIVRDLGLSQIRVLSTKDRQYVGAAGFGVEIVGTEIL